MRTRRWIAAMVLAGAAACGGGTGDGDGGVAVEVRATEAPFALAFSSGGRTVATLADGDAPAFFLTDGTTRTDPVGLPERGVQDGRTVWSWHLSDGRGARVSWGAGPEGSAEVEFRADSLGPDERLAVRFAVSADEAFYGLTERVVQTDSQADVWAPGRTEALDLRGQDVALEMRPTVALYSPFYVSSAGYGVFFDSDWPARYRFGVDGPTVVEVRYEADPAAPAVRLRLFPGPAPLDAVRRYARSVGPSILPPPWAFGPWRWRDQNWALSSFWDGTPWDGPYNSTVVEDVLMMGHYGIPCSLYWVDRPWGPGSFGYDDLQWDEARFPQHEAMIDWLASRGMRFAVWIAPWAVGPTMATQAVERGYAVAAENPFSSPPAPEANLIDLTNPDATAWWQDALAARIQADGLSGFKCDRGEEKPPDGLFVQGAYHDGTSFREGRNAYPFWYARAVDGAFDRAGVAERVSIFRAGWVGSQRHAVFWAGDTDTGPWGLRSAIIAVQRAATMGFPIWGSDTCGYAGAPAAHETCMRWMAFSAFTPLMEVGPTANSGPWAMPLDGADYTDQGFPPGYDVDLIAAWILYANVHQDLAPYTRALAAQAHADGTPIVRPMALVHPERLEYRDLYGQYYYGPDVVVAPVWQPGQATADVHVPPEGTWRDAWTGAPVAGGTVVTLDAPEHRVPLLVRDGGAVNLGDLPARWQAALAKARDVPDMAALAATVE